MPRPALLSHRRARLYEVAGSEEVAAQLYMAATQVWPAYRLAWHDLAAAQMRSGQFEGATQTLAVLAARAPGDAAAQRAWGIAAASSGADVDAEAALLRAVQLDGEDVVARRALAALFGQRHQWDVAAAALRDATRWAPHDAELAFELGRAEAEAGDIAAAREALRRALELDPANAAAAALLAQLR